VDVAVGKALNRALAGDAQVDAEIDAFISRQDQKRRREEGERQEEMAWMESTRKHNAARDAELRAEWSEYHQEQAERLRANLAVLVAHHEEQAQKLGAPVSLEAGGQTSD
jgi:hypothetical protein